MRRDDFFYDWPLILAYHSVNDQREDCLAVRVADFERQLAWLARRGYRSLTLAEFRRQEIQKGERVVILTFDDGYADNYTYAFPLLKRYGFVATIFLVSDYVDTDHVYWWDEPLLKTASQRHLYHPLSWRQVEEMATYGIEFGSHTCTHPKRLTGLSPEESWHEIMDSRIALQTKLGTEVNSFCYPLGDLNSNMIQMVEQAGYDCAVVTPTRPGIPLNRFTLRRISIYRDNSPWLVRLKMTGIFRRNYEHLRRLR